MTKYKISIEKRDEEQIRHATKKWGFITEADPDLLYSWARHVGEMVSETLVREERNNG